MIYKNKKIIWIFLLPTLVFVSLFLYLPFLVSLFNSLFDISNLAGLGKTFIGIKNYEELLTDSVVITAVKNTFMMMMLTVIFEVGFAVVLALLVDSVGKTQRFYRTVFFFPVVISATAIGLMFILFYDYNIGLFNQILIKFGSKPVLWLDEKRALGMLSLPVIWQYIGFYFVIVLTGIASIPEDIYESAYLEGATGFQKVRYITLPLIKGVIRTCLILVITGTLKVFDLPWTIAPRGMPNETTYLLGTYQYKTVYEASRVGYGCTIAVFIVIVGVIVSTAVNKLLKQEDI
ncbi:carbohydrate ABC transporter permease [Cellulosilyticum sp. I15G10I2]|uniref:carbohydrate ABC transporter permease n=1 Tax=Cellulosilyticum sp. I15G10I2 TaxID=1892843 RepID=UPI001495B616|nr:sugar ABC transporter permease [Cellulosilyticum sp. I15G10I2]